MKVPSKRKFLGSIGRKAPDGGYYAKYDSVEQAIQDLRELFEYNRFPEDIKTVEDYSAELRQDGYYTDTYYNYTNALRAWLKKL